MIWKKGAKTLKTPSEYSADIEDLDDESYTSVVDGTLIDTVIAVGMLKLYMSWEFNTEEEAEELIQETYENPLVLTVKVPVVKGGILENAKYRVSKRKINCIKTEKGESTSETKWKVSFNLMQKELTDAQKKAVEEANR